MSYFYFTATLLTSMRQMTHTTPLILRKLHSYCFWLHFFFSLNLIELISHFILITIQVNGINIVTGKFGPELFLQFYSYILTYCSSVQINSVCSFSSNGQRNNSRRTTEYSLSGYIYWHQSRYFPQRIG